MVVVGLVDARGAGDAQAVDEDRAGRAEVVDVGREPAAVVPATHLPVSPNSRLSV